MTVANIQKSCDSCKLGRHNDYKMIIHITVEVLNTKTQDRHTTDKAHVQTNFK